MSQFKWDLNIIPLSSFTTRHIFYRIRSHGSNRPTVTSALYAVTIKLTAKSMIPV